MKIDTNCWKLSFKPVIMRVQFSTTGVSSAVLKLYAKKKKHSSIHQNSDSPIRMM